MRIVVVSPLPSADNSFSSFIREEVKREAEKNAYSYQEINSKTRSVDINSVSVLCDDSGNSLSKEIKRIQFSSLIKKLKADVVLQLSGMTLSGISAKQYHAVSPAYYDRNAVNTKPEKYAFANRGKIFTEKNEFIVASDPMCIALKDVAGADPNKVHTIFSSETVTACDWQQREHIKEGLTDGMEFFYSDARFAKKNELIELLKAFSVFKKWQRSSMQLVLRLRSSNAIDEELSNYKYRHDIRVTETDDVLPAAYAIVQPYKDVNPASIQNASLLGAATIAVESDMLPSDQKELFLITENNVEHMGQAMIALYKNEQRRNSLGESAKRFYDTVTGKTLFDIFLK